MTYLNITLLLARTPSDVFVEPKCGGFSLCLHCSGPVNGDIVFEVQICLISITKDGERLNIPNFNEALTVVFSLHYICKQA